MRSIFLVFLIAAAAASAVFAGGRGEGGAGARGEAEERSEPVSAPVSEGAAVAGRLSAADVGLPEPPGNAVELLEVTDEYRLIRHDAGETRVPANPLRIVSLYPPYTEDLIALGRRPVGSSYANGKKGEITPAIPDEGQGITSIGDNWDVNIESVLALEPDLIIARPWAFNEIPHEQWEAIAPTVSIGKQTGPTYDWRTLLEDMALIVGEEEKAQSLINQFYEDAAALDERIPDMDFSLLRPRPELMQLYGTTAAITRITGALGLSITPVPEGATNRWGDDGKMAGQISYETLNLIQGETFFVISYNLEPDAMADFQAGQVWNALPVVKAGKAFFIEGTAWTNHGYFGVYEVMKEVEQALLGGG